MSTRFYFSIIGLRDRRHSSIVLCRKKNIEGKRTALLTRNTLAPRLSPQQKIFCHLELCPYGLRHTFSITSMSCTYVATVSAPEATPVKRCHCHSNSKNLVQCALDLPSKASPAGPAAQFAGSFCCKHLPTPHHSTATPAGPSRHTSPPRHCVTPTHPALFWPTGSPCLPSDKPS